MHLQEQYNADAETWSSEQAALQADLAALAAQTALKSLALDAMMRNSNRATQGAGGHSIGGPLWQQVLPFTMQTVGHCTLVEPNKRNTDTIVGQQFVFQLWLKVFRCCMHWDC